MLNGVLLPLSDEQRIFASSERRCRGAETFGDPSAPTTILRPQ